MPDLAIDRAIAAVRQEMWPGDETPDPKQRLADLNAALAILEAAKAWADSWPTPPTDWLDPQGEAGRLYHAIRGDAP